METEKGTTASMWSREGLTDHTASRLGLKQDVICRGWGGKGAQSEVNNRGK